jgi:hypothetical protein
MNIQTDKQIDKRQTDNETDRQTYLMKLFSFY